MGLTYYYYPVLKSLDRKKIVDKKFREIEFHDFFREIELGIPILFQFLFSLLKIIREIHFHKKIFVTSFFRTE